MQENKMKIIIKLSPFAHART